MNNRWCFLILLLTACLDQPVDTATLDQDLCRVDVDCEPTPTLGAPTPKVVARTADSLTVQYKNSTAYRSTTLEHRAPNGTWSALSTVAGAMTTRTYVHGGRTPDSIRCYRVRATDGVETAYSNEACGLTASNSPSLFRAQLHLVVANVTDGGSSDRVGVNLGRLSLPGYNHTGLDYAPTKVVTPNQPYIYWLDDFQRGRDRTYDLDLANLSSVRDITELTIHKYGSDGLCIERFELILNNKIAVARTFGSTSSTCRWLDRAPGLSEEFSISFNELRATASFIGFTNPFPTTAPCADGSTNAICTTISRDELEQRVEGMVGNKLWTAGEVGWDASEIYGRAAVEASKAAGSNNTIHVDLDLAGHIDWFPDPEVDVDFDIQATFTGSTLKLDVMNVDVNADYSVWGEILGALMTPLCAPELGKLHCTAAVENEIENKLAAAFTSPRPIPFDASSCTALDAIVLADGALQLKCTL